MASAGPKCNHQIEFQPQNQSDIPRLAKVVSTDSLWQDLKTLGVGKR